jgi:hypothetical protein
MIAIILLLLIIIVLFLLFNKKKKKKNKKIEQINDKIIKSKINFEIESQTQQIVNPIFIDVQYSRNYWDTLMAFNIIAPYQKIMFNKSNLSVTSSKAKIKDIKEIIDNFINNLNEIIINKISDERNKLTGCDENFPEQKYESGWDKQMKKLGLPSTMYDVNAEKDIINLIDISKFKKQETEKQIRYIVFLIIQKNNINEQALIKITFLIDKKEINKYDHREIIIEQIFILGFLINDNHPTDKSIFDTFYNYNGLNNDNTINQNLVLKELMNKYDLRLKSMENFSKKIEDLI